MFHYFHRAGVPFLFRYRTVVVERSFSRCSRTFFSPLIRASRSFAKNNRSLVLRRSPLSRKRKGGKVLRRFRFVSFRFVFVVRNTVSEYNQFGNPVTKEASKHSAEILRTRKLARAETKRSRGSDINEPCSQLSRPRETRIFEAKPNAPVTVRRFAVHSAGNLQFK